MKRTGADFRPSCSIEQLRVRARCNASIRNFFSNRGVLEVETPILGSSTATDPQLESFHSTVKYQGSSLKYFLHTSPELPMKRLLASGSGDIYQICKTFRQSEFGSRHNPEFTMLEWYRTNFSLADLMSEVDELVRLIVPGLMPSEYVSYRDIFLTELNIDPFNISVEHLNELCRSRASYDGPDLEFNESLDLLLAVCIEPKLGSKKPVFLTDYPASQASLAKVRTDEYGNKVALRFELYINGLELANGYEELTDPVEQLTRFEQDNVQRSSLDLDVVPIDHRFLEALRSGMPECSGVALGVDRLLMVKKNTKSIHDVISFPVDVS